MGCCKSKPKADPEDLPSAPLYTPLKPGTDNFPITNSVPKDYDKISLYDSPYKNETIRDKTAFVGIVVDDKSLAGSLHGSVRSRKSQARQSQRKAVVKAANEELTRTPSTKL